MITGKSSLWQAAFARNSTMLHYCSAPFCLRQVHQTVNKMCCKYVILLIIYIQETITLQRHSCSVWRIKDPKTYISEWLDSGKHKYAILLLLSLYLWSLEIDREGVSELLGKYTSCFIFTASISIILLVSAHLQWNVLEYYLKWNDHQSQTVQRHKLLLLLLLLIRLAPFILYIWTLLTLYLHWNNWPAILPDSFSNMVRAHT